MHLVTFSMTGLNTLSQKQPKRKFSSQCLCPVPGSCSILCWQLCLFYNLLKFIFQLLLGSLPTSLILYFSFWHFRYFINCYALKWQTARKQMDTRMKHSQNSGTLARLLKVMKEERIANDSSAEEHSQSSVQESKDTAQTISSTLLGGSFDQILPWNGSCQHCSHH